MPKVAKIGLKTDINQLGDDCVKRAPDRLSARRVDVDVIVVENKNNGAGESITVTIDRAEAANVLDPVPPASTVIAPGASIEWKVKAAIAGVVGFNFKTVPQS